MTLHVVLHIHFHLRMGSAFLLLSLLIGAHTFEIRKMENSKNHQDITRSAILLASVKACERIQTYRQPTELNSKTLAETCVKGTHGNFEKAIQIISYYNVMTDLKHIPDAEYHFDNEKFEEGKDLITTGIENIIKSIQNNQFDDARKTLGKILHTLQDFYSHSNWIELGNTEPCTALINEMEIPNRAGTDVKTCVENCENGNCGAQFLDKILKENILTSGYFGIRKPSGKCSHGGFLDLTTGIWRNWDGINKDYSQDSSHGSRHKEAADVAIKASVQLLDKIRENVDKEGGINFLRLMGLHPTPPKGKWKPSFSIFHFKSRYPEAMDINDDL